MFRQLARPKTRIIEAKNNKNLQNANQGGVRAYIYGSIFGPENHLSILFGCLS
jgi:hypothetical protein